MKVEGSNVTTQNTNVQPVKQQEFETKVRVEARKVAEQVQSKAELPVDERLKEYPEYVPSIPEKTWIDAVETANKKLEGANTEFRFSVHEATNQVSVKVLNKDTGEVIREIPPEKILDMVAKMWEMAGIFVDERR
ncbi:MAG TPA: flagellar biosynthesis protein FlaG [Clostridiales bacterium]|nr:MAG: hypothetical protein A2Y22_02775 [Clostridiales bacterium GWD2_32_59]HAN10732.1 flagellar biosynthesis protein FlaG [Clostridiales bacterium]